MLKETEKTLSLFVTFLSLVAFQLAGGGGPLGTSLSLRFSLRLLYAKLSTLLITGVSKILYTGNLCKAYMLLASRNMYRF